MILVDDHAWCATRIYVIPVISPDTPILYTSQKYKLEGVMSEEQDAQAHGHVSLVQGFPYHQFK